MQIETFTVVYVGVKMCVSVCVCRIVFLCVTRWAVVHHSWLSICKNT